MDKMNNALPPQEGNAPKVGFFAKLVEQAYEFMDNKRNRWITLGVLAVIAATVPLYGNAYLLNVLITAMFYMLLALGLNVIIGFTGLCDLGYIAKFAIGAYTTGILMLRFNWSFWLTIPAAIVVAMLAAVATGAPTLRLRSDYLAIVTLGFAEIIRITTRNLEITGKATGLNAIPRPEFFGIRLSKMTHWYVVFLILVVLFVIITNRIKNSRFGRAIEFIREDEDAAEAMGIDTTRYKLWAYIMGAVLGAIAGCFYAVKMMAITPNDLTFTMSANVLLAVVLGGMGKIPGVIMGAAVFSILPELLRDVPVVGDMRMLFFGLLLIIVMIFRPQGLWPERRR